MKNRIKEIRNKQKMSATKLANIVGISRPYLSQLENHSAGKKLNVDLMPKFAEALGVPVSALLASDSSVPVVGRIGAGGDVELVDAYEKGDGLFHVSCPSDLPPDEIVAVEVVGNSMSPIIQSGDILFFTRHFVGVDPEAINRVSIVETRDGRAMVKHMILGREPDSFDLISANNSNPTEYGVQISWATPMRRHIAKADIMRS